MALRATEGHVYAIEKKEEAAALLLENKRSSARTILPLFPVRLRRHSRLPAPTHAFIGGSSGKLPEIVQILLKKNPKITIVINCITLETISEVLQVLQSRPELSSEVVQMSVSRSRSVGSYHMMMGKTRFIL